MDVVLLRWPHDADRRRRLADDGHARLLLVDHDHVPPDVIDPLEDWIRVPAADLDVQARVRTLHARGAGQVSLAPTLDDHGVLRLGTAWTSLPPVEARITALLMDRIGAVVAREALAKAGWPDGAPGRNALDVHVLRLRRRLLPVGLVIRTVRSRGYLLERDGSAVAAAITEGRAPVAAMSDVRQQSVGQA
jgi:DNA-binding winged helix-turn-helix (wHTH) protein